MLYHIRCSVYSASAAGGHSSKFDAEGRNLVDAELIAMAEMLMEMKKVEDLAC